MKHFYRFAWLCLFAALSFTTLQAQESEKGSLTVSLNQDVFFGFYPAVFGSYELNDKLDLAFYGIFWTTPNFGSGLPQGGGGGSLWTEFGAGVSFDAGPLTVTPQLGILNGKLLSNGEFGRFFDGIVPNLTIDLNNDLFEGQIYAGYYKSLTPGLMTGDDGSLVDVNSTNDFIHYWANLGIAPTSFFSAGIHWEHLYFTPANINTDAFAGGTEPVAADLYQWFGPYVQLSHPEGHSLRFLGGPQFVGDGGNSTFYKLTATFGF